MNASRIREMQQISALYDRHPGADIYIVGTGTSLRVFPLDVLAGKITIGLNQAWKVVNTTYAITMMPRLNIPEFIKGETPRPKITWITKPSKLREQCTAEEIEFANENFYGFENNGQQSLTGLDGAPSSPRQALPLDLDLADGNESCRQHGGAKHFPCRL